MVEHKFVIDFYNLLVNFHLGFVSSLYSRVVLDARAGGAANLRVFVVILIS